ncbi:MAG TPA: hypothetical protein VEP67_11080 [Thiobacillaceae bacterium]|nr:hypothetical protein [Thiobacillaceae bacterium]
MRALIFVLVLLNLAVVGHFLWVKPSASLSEDRISLHSDRISLRRTEVTVAVQSGPASGKSKSEVICVEWRGLPADEFEHGRDALRSLASEQPLSIIETPLEKMYWVVFPPLPSRDAALTKLGEIEALGIKNASIINKDSLRDGISLGMYDSEEFARRRVLNLEAKGLNGLNIESKPKQGTGYYFVIKSEQPEVLKRLDKLRQTYPSTTLSRVDCHV